MKRKLSSVKTFSFEACAQLILNVLLVKARKNAHVSETMVTVTLHIYDETHKTENREILKHTSVKVYAENTLPLFIISFENEPREERKENEYKRKKALNLIYNNNATYI